MVKVFILLLIDIYIYLIVINCNYNINFFILRRFKALQNLVTIYFSLGQNDKMIERYRTMLIYMSKVTRNECTDAINIILDTLQSADLSNGLDLSEVLFLFIIFYHEYYHNSMEFIYLFIL